MSNLTPMMQQYLSIKRKYPDAILFYRLGDFYEMFFDDAQIASRVLELALTARNKGGGEKAPMAGVPYHSADSYIARLIENGYKVAICEQLEDPEEASGIVERDVVRVITPGTVIESEILREKENNYLASLIKYKESMGFSYIDVSTGEFMVTEVPYTMGEKLWDEIDRIQPKELIIQEELTVKEKYKLLEKQLGFYRNSIKIDRVENAHQVLTGHFEVHSLACFGIEEMEAAILAAGEIIKFLENTQKRELGHLSKISYYSLNEFMVIDTATRRNLELISTIREKRKKGSLIDILDQSVTSMGGRLIKKWINQPLLEKEQIEKRLDAVEELINNYVSIQKIRNYLEGIYDLERILSRVTYGTANARDLYALRLSLEKLPGLKEMLEFFNSTLILELNDNLDTLEDVTDILQKSIVDDPPVNVREGGIIKNGYNHELDELRVTRKGGKEWITNLQKTERERTGINSLKVGYNKVFGYYLEVTKANLDKVPDDYTRKQTLSNSERYITPELKDKEALVLGAEERISELEYEIFVSIREFIKGNLLRIKSTASIIATVDVLSSLAVVALGNNYQRPELQTDSIIEIKEGRHPVVEKMVEENFVPNDTYLDRQENRFIIITGPNMSGKSTYMRQVALIVLMAQIGSFVPASSARIGIVDRIFTRVGASDDLTTGQSTFMVEMNEVANIINNATNKSLIILDEVGRGTSTYDGLSIAWAVSEYINNPEKIGARALFATHYHELTKLEEKYKGIKNYNVLVEEDQEGVHFLHKIVPGSANDSYGIEVAKLAGLPGELIDSARLILNTLENGEEIHINEIAAVTEKRQLALFDSRENRRLKKIVEKLNKIDLMNITPLQAMAILHELIEEANDEEGEKHGEN